MLYSRILVTTKSQTEDYAATYHFRLAAMRAHAQIQRVRNTNVFIALHRWKPVAGQHFLWISGKNLLFISLTRLQVRSPSWSSLGQDGAASRLSSLSSFWENLSLHLLQLTASFISTASDGQLGLFLDTLLSEWFFLLPWVMRALGIRLSLPSQEKKIPI